MNFKSYLKIAGTLITSGALPTVLVNLGIHDPKIIGVATAVTALTALFTRQPHKDEEHDEKKLAQKIAGDNLNSW